jgi:hypothetical protein
MSKDGFLPQRIHQIPQVGCNRPHMQSQQRSDRVNTDFDRFITHHAPLEPISVVRFVRSCGRRHHSPRQLRFVPLPVDVWSTETSDKRAPGGISYTSIDFTPIETMFRSATPQSTSLEGLAVFDLSSVATTRRQVVDWFKDPRFMSLTIATACPKAHSWFYIHIDRPCARLTSVCPTKTACACSIRSGLCSSTGGGNWILWISPHSGKKKE